TFTLAFAKRTYTDLGTIAKGAMQTSANHMLDGSATTAGYFLMATAVGNASTITVHPHMPALLDTEFQRLNADESALGALVNSSDVGDDAASFVQAGNGWTAFVVTAV